MITPIFLFSLPRSGSTLVQRVLGGHPEIATVSEPWILLPFLYTLREQGAYANYAHHGAVNAIKDFYDEFPGGRNDYLAELRQFVLNLYGKTAVYQNQLYFLDKTPRYHLVVEDIIELFPDGKFVFLWRNPLAIAASIIQTWGEGDWILYRFHVDLYEGLNNLTKAYENNKEVACSIQYEDIVSGSDKIWERIFAYLELPFDPSLLATFVDIPLKGRYGDMEGTARYKAINSEPVEKWKATYHNSIRQKWAHRYLQQIGDSPLRTMGYQIDQLHAELNSISTSYRGSILHDLARLAYGKIYVKFEPQILNRYLQRRR